jgi:hypothetical protein
LHQGLANGLASPIRLTPFGEASIRLAALGDDAAHLPKPFTLKIEMKEKLSNDKSFHG